MQPVSRVGSIPVLQRKTSNLKKKNDYYSEMFLYEKLPKENTKFGSIMQMQATITIGIFCLN